MEALWDVPGSVLTGLGHYQPERILPTDDLAPTLDTSDEWIRTRTGIRQRRIAAPDETVADMAVHAARMALAEAGAASVSLVVVATSTTSSRMPSTAGRVVDALGLGTAAVLDVNAACSGFAYAIGVADQAIRAGSASSALVIGADKFSEVVDWTDRRTCVLVGDGAGAAVLQASDATRVGPTRWGSVPGMVDTVRIDGDPALFAQEGQTVFRWAVTEAAVHARAIVAAAGLDMEDIDVFAFHQANLRIIDPLAKALDSGDRLVIRDVADSGNTASASIPLGLSKAWHEGLIAPGSRVLVFGFGAGFTYAGQVLHAPAVALASAAG